MAQRRGITNPERLALDFASVTTTATLVGAPCFVYSVLFSLLNTNATGIAQIADTSASADAFKELAKIDVTLGAGGASAAGQNQVINFNPPLYVSKTLVGAITGTKISVSYLAAS